jgi:hypothetical protein
VTQAEEVPKPGPRRPKDHTVELTELRLEVAKWRVIAFHGIPFIHHHHVTGDAAQDIEDKAHLLADLLGLLPLTKQETNHE